MGEFLLAWNGKPVYRSDEKPSNPRFGIDRETSIEGTTRIRLTSFVGVGESAFTVLLTHIERPEERGLHVLHLTVEPSDETTKINRRQACHVVPGQYGVVQFPKNTFRVYHKAGI